MIPLAHHHNRAQDWKNKKAAHERHLAKTDKKLEGIKALKEKLWEGSGEVEETGDFGPMYRNFRHDAKGAIEHLKRTKTGEAIAALHHPEVGDIDLVWGKEGTGKSDGAGLAKLVKYHPEVVDDLQGILLTLRKDDKRSTTRRIQLESKDHQAGIRLDWDGKQKHWLLTAFEKRAGDSTRTDIMGLTGRDDTARSSTSSNKSIQQPQKKSSPGEVGEKPEAFVKAPDGSTDFGEITPEISKHIRRQAGVIKLQAGIESPSEKYGVAHIEAGHKKEIEALGLSIPEFVAKATQKPDEIRQGKGGALLLVKQITTKPALGKLVFVRLKPSGKGDFYRVETAFVKPMGKVSKNYPLLWSASVPHSTESSIPPASATAPSKPAGDGRSTGAPAQSNDNKSIAQAGEKSSPFATTGKDSEVKTAKGTKVNTQFAVIDAGDLITSHDQSGNTNPSYPQALQPRNRERATSQAQIARIAKNLDPDMLGRTRNASAGAPIIGDDGVVESGNGRTMAIRMAYQNGHADDYRDWLENDAADMYGLDAKKIKAMKHPVLVRVRKTDVDRAQFAREANQSDMLAMTATEKASQSPPERGDLALIPLLVN